MERAIDDWRATYFSCMRDTMPNSSISDGRQHLLYINSDVACAIALRQSDRELDPVFTEVGH
jgi:hypothetical protein